MSTFNKLKGRLSNNDKQYISELVSKGCSYKVRQAIESALYRRASTVPYNEILNNIVKENDEWKIATTNNYDFIKIRQAIRKV